jgi:bifunctional DNA-binding transcriptional regulator/antitoxin component of YhaV-PrlF toxin-antitoxin module
MIPSAIIIGPLAGFTLHPYIPPMLAKLTAKNQLTLPKRALDALGLAPSPDYFEVAVEDGRIILTPARVTSADAVRRKLADLGITDADVTDAVAWARRHA